MWPEHRRNRNDDFLMSRSDGSSHHDYQTSEYEPNYPHWNQPKYSPIRIANKKTSTSNSERNFPIGPERIWKNAIGSVRNSQDEYYDRQYQRNQREESRSPTRTRYYDTPHTKTKNIERKRHYGAFKHYGGFERNTKNISPDTSFEQPCYRKTTSHSVSSEPSIQYKSHYAVKSYRKYNGPKKRSSTAAFSSGDSDDSFIDKSRNDTNPTTREKTRNRIVSSPKAHERHTNNEIHSPTRYHKRTSKSSLENKVNSTKSLSSDKIIKEILKGGNFRKTNTLEKNRHDTIKHNERFKRNTDRITADTSLEERCHRKTSHSVPSEPSIYHSKPQYAFEHNRKYKTRDIRSSITTLSSEDSFDSLIDNSLNDIDVQNREKTKNVPAEHYTKNKIYSPTRYQEPYSKNSTETKINSTASFSSVCEIEPVIGMRNSKKICIEYWKDITKIGIEKPKIHDSLFDAYALQTQGSHHAARDPRCKSNESTSTTSPTTSNFNPNIIHEKTRENQDLISPSSSFGRISIASVSNDASFLRNETTNPTSPTTSNCDPKSIRKKTNENHHVVNPSFASGRISLASVSNDVPSPNFSPLSSDDTAVVFLEESKICYNPDYSKDVFLRRIKQNSRKKLRKKYRDTSNHNQREVITIADGKEEPTYDPRLIMNLKENACKKMEELGKRRNPRRIKVREWCNDLDTFILKHSDCNTNQFGFIPPALAPPRSILIPYENLQCYKYSSKNNTCID